MSKKKILYLITKGNWGGAQRYVFDLATSLSPDEFAVAVATGQNGLLTEKLAIYGMRVLLVPTLQRNISVLKEIRSFFTLLKLFRMEQPDIIHLNSSKAACLGALAARLFRFSLSSKVKGQRLKVPRVIFTVHGWPFLEKRNIVTRSMIRVASWLTALLSHNVIVVSEHDLRSAHRLPFIGKKTSRIYNGIAPMVFGSGERIRNAFPHGARITGTIGELTRNKNQQMLIESARKDPDMFVAIVGEGELRPALDALLKKHGLESRVKLFGFIPANEALRGFDTFALPSLKEGLPYVLLEAKAAGLPIVANRVGGVGEILDQNGLGECTLEEMLRRTLGIYNSL